MPLLEKDCCCCCYTSISACSIFSVQSVILHVVSLMFLKSHGCLWCLIDVSLHNSSCWYWTAIWNQALVFTWIMKLFKALLTLGLLPILSLSRIKKKKSTKKKIILVLSLEVTLKFYPTLHCVAAYYEITTACLFKGLGAKEQGLNFSSGWVGSDKLHRFQCIWGRFWS